MGSIFLLPIEIYVYIFVYIYDYICVQLTIYYIIDMLYKINIIKYNKYYILYIM